MPDVFYRDFQVDPKIHMEIQGTQSSGTNSEEEKQTCRTCTAKNRELRTEINLQIYIQLISTKVLTQASGKEHSFQQMILG